MSVWKVLLKKINNIALARVMLVYIVFYILYDYNERLEGKDVIFSEYLAFLL